MNATRTLTLLHIALAGFLLCVVLGLLFSEATVFDRLTPPAFWLWLLGSPALGLAALAQDKKSPIQSLRIVNMALLGLWFVGLLNILLARH